MDTSMHNINTLFAQLGLDDDDKSIEAFIEHHSPLPPEVGLSEAGFWSRSQAYFLKEAVEEDSDWAEVVDQLNVLLRE